MGGRRFSRVFLAGRKRATLAELEQSCQGGCGFEGAELCRGFGRFGFSVCSLSRLQLESGLVPSGQDADKELLNRPQNGPVYRALCGVPPVQILVGGQEAHPHTPDQAQLAEAERALLQPAQVPLAAEGAAGRRDDHEGLAGLEERVLADRVFQPPAPRLVVQTHERRHGWEVQETSAHQTPCAPPHQDDGAVWVLPAHDPDLK